MDYIPKLISVIVPIYNARDYLDRCVESIVNQIYSNIEIILVDDGSNDGSEKLCDKWEKSDKRIKVFHKSNGGASSARNLGLEIARGEFIGFVDSDDYIKKDMYSELLSSLGEEIDIACCGTVMDYPDKMQKQRKVTGKTRNPVVFSNEEAIREMLLIRKINIACWNKLYRRELFRTIRFPVGHVCEDYPVTYAVLKKCRNIVFIGEVKYYHTYRVGSVSKSPFEIGKLSYVLFARDIYKDVIRNYPNEKRYGEALYVRSVVETFREISNCTDQDKYEYIQKRFRKFMRRMICNILSNQHIPEYTKKEVLTILFSTEDQL